MKKNLFENKNCFISGATGGIGKQIVKKLVQNKCNIFMTATQKEKLEVLKADLHQFCAKNQKMFYEEGDLNSLSHVEKIIAKCNKWMPSIDILINCAGVFIVKSLSDCSCEDIEKSFNINTRAAILFSKAFTGSMVKKKWGRVINIGSSASYNGFKDTSLYCATKHALLGFSRSLHAELRGDNVRVYCISPAGTQTEMGKLIQNQDYTTFISAEEIAEYIVFVSSFDKEMVSEEIRLNRMIMQ